MILAFTTAQRLIPTTYAFFMTNVQYMITLATVRIKTTVCPDKKGHRELWDSLALGASLQQEGDWVTVCLFVCLIPSHQSRRNSRAMLQLFPCLLEIGFTPGRYGFSTATTAEGDIQPIRRRLEVRKLADE